MTDTAGANNKAEQDETSAEVDDTEDQGDPSSVAFGSVGSADAPDDDEIGYCDECDEPHNVGDQTDHCRECGNCWEHCSCTPKRTIESNFDEDLASGLLGDPKDWGIGACTHPGCTCAAR
jgi:hypothetical protein